MSYSHAFASTLALGLLLAGAPSLAQDGPANLRDTLGKSPPTPAAPTPDLEPRVSYTRRQLLRLGNANVVTGRYDGFLDGSLLLSNPRDPVIRQRIAKHQQLPLSKVPARVTRSFLLGPTFSITADDLEALKGKQVEAAVVMDSKGFFLVQKLEAVISPASSETPTP